MKEVLAIAIKNIVSMLITKNMILWALEKAAQTTDNKIDDNCVKLVKAGYESDMESLKQAIDDILIDIKSK